MLMMLNSLNPVAQLPITALVGLEQASRSRPDMDKVPRASLACAHWFRPASYRTRRTASTTWLPSGSVTIMPP
jgi:hypothetical protein